MEIDRTLTPSEGDSAVALGNFDGLHVGHRKVISLALDGASEGLLPTVFTFAENPLADLGGGAGGRLLSQEDKIAVLEHMGVKQLYILEFRAVKDLSAEEFVDRILIGCLKAKKVCCGFNFTFGRGGKADSSTLAGLCGARGVAVSVAKAVMVGGTPVSSTRIRGLLEAGRAGEAAKLLGRPFGYCMPVRRGRRLGHSLGTPTLNQELPKGFVQPKFGVYVSQVLVENQRYAGVTNVGVKPTVGSDQPLSETWMPDYRGGELYGRTVRVELLRFLRPERRFPTLEDLRAQILRDGAQAREFFSQDVSAARRI
ncbi:riboflavin biosynthesis protein RibF [Caproiciproducens sp. NJN-50]|uniref:riboflavin biosynthesis protein RibF n=1 Tax=Acutalibacteraceae TaxID=3082771 RepID=UPI000FFE02D7|nr:MULTISPECIES: riboflavin biosynthesis protein RibF [Acutalibacteraceae]QAT51134.1 riboflavin biosynthesis protein RibF [Caproiciproducens sp. NJN-50]